MDQRRLTVQDRESFKPQQRNQALERVQAYRAQSNWQQNRQKFSTEQKPGSGGFQMGPLQQAIRNWEEKSKEQRAENARPEVEKVDNSNQLDNPREDTYTEPKKVDAAALQAEAKGGKYF